VDLDYDHITEYEPAAGKEAEAFFRDPVPKSRREFWQLEIV
jgi:hypothetical protein